MIMARESIYYRNWFVTQYITYLNIWGVLQRNFFSLLTHDRQLGKHPIDKELIANIEVVLADYFTNILNEAEDGKLSLAKINNYISQSLTDNKSKMPFKMFI
jgi:hypothetical protein